MKVKIMNYDQQWANKFREEAKKIKEVFGDGLIAIHYFGSTSIPGLQAKPY